MNTLQKRYGIYALVWLMVIYLFLPLGPAVMNFFYKHFGYETVKYALISITVSIAFFIFYLYWRRFKTARLQPYIYSALILFSICLINYNLKTPARVLHIPEYAILSFLTLRFAKSIMKRSKAIVFAICSGIISGVIDEALIQRILPNRFFDPTDMVLNLLGILAGIALSFSYSMSKTG